MCFYALFVLFSVGIVTKNISYYNKCNDVTEIEELLLEKFQQLWDRPILPAGINFSSNYLNKGHTRNTTNEGKTNITDDNYHNKNTLYGNKDIIESIICNEKLL